MQFWTDSQQKQWLSPPTLGCQELDMISPLSQTVTHAVTDHTRCTITQWNTIISPRYDQNTVKTRMWANAQCDGRPAYYRWRPLFNAAVWLTPTISVPCSNAANTRNSLKFAGVPQTRQRISAVSRPKFAILWVHVEEVLLLNKFFSDCGYVP